MPTVIIGLILIVLFSCLAILYLKKSGKEFNLGNKKINIVIFVLSLVCLGISMKLFWNMGIYADEHGSSPILVSGGWFWLSMDWIRLGILLVLSVVSGLGLINRSK